MALLTLVTLLSLAVFNSVFASPCIVFDANFNLLAFGMNGKDYNAGQQDTWSSTTPALDITSSGRPPFDGSSTTCYLSQFANAVYVLGADSTKPSAVHIYNAADKSWSVQEANAGSFDPRSFNAILDRDTNVFYALSHGDLFFLDMGSLKAAQNSALSWTDVQKAPFPDNYQPVMALAQNHIHFLNLPDAPAGTAEIFVIHYSYFQPQPQSYPAVSGGSTFPTTRGQVASFFQEELVQQEFAFIPDDGSATYVVSVVTNTTQTLPGPPTKDPKATYFAGITSLVQLDSNGTVSFIPYETGKSNSSSSNWSTVMSMRAAVPPGSMVSHQANDTSQAANQPNPPNQQNAGQMNCVISLIPATVLICCVLLDLFLY